MRFGVCTGLDQLEAANLAGFDYVETSIVAMEELCNSDFERIARAVDNSPIKVEAGNCLFPSYMNIIGRGADLDVVDRYLERVFSRLERLGAKIAVFGSGSVRRVNSGMSYDDCFDSLAHLLVRMNGHATRFGIVVAIEPLNKKETDLINTTDEAARLARRVGLPNIKILADLYHTTLENEDVSALERFRNILCHIHIANPDGRCYPKAGDEAIFDPFFDALKLSGYDARVSVEAGSSGDLASDMAEAAAFLRRYK